METFNRRELLLLLTCVLILFLMKIWSKDPVYTGDEPRYLHMAYSFFHDLNFHLPYEDWVKWCAEHHIRLYPPEALIPLHSPIHSIFVSPFVGLFGPGGGRWAQFFIGVIGFVYSASLMKRLLNPWGAIGATFVAFITMPLFSYMNLLYSEIWLFSTFIVSWQTINREKLTIATVSTGLVFALALPFFHIRMALVSAALVLFLLVRIWFESERVDMKKYVVATVVSFSAAVFAILLLFQMLWTGSLAGSASAPFQPGLLLFFERLGIQLLTIRHGLLIVNPALIFAIAGLIIGVKMKDRQAIQGVILLFLYCITFVWGAASDSFPARFWVAIMPVFVLGIALWLKNVNTLAGYLVTGLLTLISLLNVGVFLVSPDTFLTNFQVANTYDAIYDIVPFFHISTLIPWDKYFFLEAKIPPFFEESLRLLIKTSLFFVCTIGFLAISQLSKQQYVKKAAGLIFLCLIFVPFYVSFMTQLAEESFDVSGWPSAQEGVAEIRINFKEPVRPSVIRFMDDYGAWVPPLYPVAFNISASTDSVNFHPLGQVRAARLVPVSIDTEIRSLKVSALNSSNSSVPKWMTQNLSILRKGGSIFGETTCFTGRRSNKITINTSNIRANLIEFGKDYLTSATGEGIGFLLSGWSTPEPWGTWSDGDSAAILLGLPALPKSDLALSIEGSAFVSDKHPTQEVEVLVNRRSVESLKYTMPSRVVRVVKIPRELASQNDGRLLIQFEFKNPKSPAELGLSGDGRRLGLGIVSLKLGAS